MNRSIRSFRYNPSKGNYYPDDTFYIVGDSKSDNRTKVAFIVDVVSYIGLKIKPSSYNDADVSSLLFRLIRIKGIGNGGTEQQFVKQRIESIVERGDDIRLKTIFEGSYRDSLGIANNSNIFGVLIELGAYQKSLDLIFSDNYLTRMIEYDGTIVVPLFRLINWFIKDFYGQVEIGNIIRGS